MAGKKRAKPVAPTNGDVPLDWMPMMSQERKQQFLDKGVQERFIVDRTTHPQYHASQWDSLGKGAELLGEQLKYRLPHLAYQSILVCAMGNMWEKDCWWKFQDMIRYTQEQGYLVSMQEVDDYSYMRPRDAIGTMRSGAALMALNAGFEWCLMVDTDVQVEKDTLLQLLKWDCPIIFPYIVDLEQKWPGSTLMRPVLPPNSGMHPVVWAAMSCMLFYTKVFNALDDHAWYGHDIHFSQQLNRVGHRIFVDTATIIHAVKGPTRHGGWTWDELQQGMEKTYYKLRNEDRDRRPPEGFDPVFASNGAQVTPDGAYWSTTAPWRKVPRMGNNDFGDPDNLKTEGGVG